jgi:hypothetical protein
MPRFEVKLYQWANTETFTVEADGPEAAKQRVVEEHLKGKDLLEDEDRQWKLGATEVPPEAVPKDQVTVGGQPDSAPQQ